MPRARETRVSLQARAVRAGPATMACAVGPLLVLQSHSRAVPSLLAVSRMAGEAGENCTAVTATCTPPGSGSMVPGLQAGVEACTSLATELSWAWLGPNSRAQLVLGSPPLAQACGGLTRCLACLALKQVAGHAPACEPAQMAAAAAGTACLSRHCCQGLSSRASHRQPSC